MGVRTARISLRLRPRQTVVVMYQLSGWPQLALALAPLDGLIACGEPGKSRLGALVVLLRQSAADRNGA